MNKKDKKALLTIIQSPEIDNRDIRVISAILLSPKVVTITTLSDTLPLSRSSIEKSVRSLKRLGVVTAQSSSDAGNAKTLSVCLDVDLQPKAQVRIGDIGDEKTR